VAVVDLGIMVLVELVDRLELVELVDHTQVVVEMEELERHQDLVVVVVLMSMDQAEQVQMVL
jgi:hypothetical protein